MEKKCSGTVHRVVAGDTMYKIAKQYGVRLVDILKENPYVNVYNLQVGDEICVPTEVYTEEERRYYTTKRGDTISIILNNTGSDIKNLFEVNKELYDIPLKENTIIRIPNKSK